MQKIKHYLNLIRISQFHKNFFVLVPLVFSGNFFEIDRLILALFAFVSFCLISALVYVVNDLFDIESDKLHPIKKYRPLASGSVSKKEALVIITLLLIINLINFFVLWSNNILFSLVVFLYLSNNIIYNLIGKKIAYLDITQNSLGFALRVLAGAVAIKVEVTLFLLVTTFLLCFSISSAKRIMELRFSDKKARKTLEMYNFKTITLLYNTSLWSFVIFYTMYTIVSEQYSRIILISVALLTYLAWRFQYLTLKSDLTSDDPNKIFLSDKINLSISILMIVLVFLSLYAF